MTIGVIGSVFRGMFDFEYDKTKGQRPRLTPTPEQWGLEGAGCSVELSPEPGVCTI